MTENNNTKQLIDELDIIVLDFTKKVQEIRKRYFDDGIGLIVISGGKNSYEVSFAIGIDQIKSETIKRIQKTENQSS